MLMVKGPFIYQNRGMLTSITSSQRSTISSHPLPEKIGLWTPQSAAR